MASLLLTLTLAATTLSSVIPRQDAAYQSTILDAHNAHRANHSAQALTWSADQASSAAALAQSCNFNHDRAGQNLAGNSVLNVAGAVSDQWYNGEFAAYDGFWGTEPPMDNFAAWGHLTQVVWKGTTEVGCFTADCTGQALGMYYTVCNYNPAGNVVGAFADNVVAPSGNPTVTG